MQLLSKNITLLTFLYFIQGRYSTKNFLVFFYFNSEPVNKKLLKFIPPGVEVKLIRRYDMKI